LAAFLLYYAHDTCIVNLFHGAELSQFCLHCAVKPEKTRYTNPQTTIENPLLNST